MRYLLDTGILIRIPDRNDPNHNDIREALRRLKNAGHSFCTTRQNIAEFWNVCTRPAAARGGLGLGTVDAVHRLRLLERFIIILGEPPSAYAKWKSLVIGHNVMGKQVHDARIVAVMGAYRIKMLLTLNDQDFTRYSGLVTAVTPSGVLAGIP